MSVTRNTLVGGPAYAAIGSGSAPLFFGDDSRVTTKIKTDVITSSLTGKIDEIYKDLDVKAVGTPLYFDTALLSFIYPFGAAEVGDAFPATDSAVVWNSNNGDIITIKSGLVIKPPDLELGVDAPVLGKLEIAGVIPNGADPSTANAYYATSTGTFAAPAVPGTALLGRQEFTAAWTGITGFTAFQAQEKWSISHEIEIEPVVTQGRIRAYRLLSYRVMAKCKPLGPTIAQIEAALKVNTTGEPGGFRLSAGTCANLVISPLGGGTHPTVTLCNAVLTQSDYVFGGKPLRNGELAWVTTGGLNGSVFTIS